MFISSVISLTALNAPAPDANHFLGREAHALFLDLVRRADAALADFLHEPRADKPFTLSALIDPRARRAVSPAIRAGAQYEWRVTAFEPRLAQVWRDAVLPNLPREVRLGSAHFQVGAAITDRAAHQWAGMTDAAELMDKWFGAPTSPPPPPPQGEGSKNTPFPRREGGRGDRSIALEFVSPTAHRQIHRNVVFPLPAQMWGGWLRAWNAYAQPAFEDDLIARVEADVALSRYALRTELVDFGEHPERGWVGTATFYCFSHERALWRVLNLLADFAFYCGTGYKTTQGMGMTRRMTPERPPERPQTAGR